MDVGGDVISVNIPLGVYITEEAFISALQEAGRDQHSKLLQFFGVKYDRAQPFVSRASGNRVYRLCHAVLVLRLLIAAVKSFLVASGVL